MDRQAKSLFYVLCVFSKAPISDRAERRMQSAESRVQLVCCVLCVVKGVVNCEL